jgi:hypothetical protein
LIESGQLEAALSDAGNPSAHVVADITDALASFLCGTGNVDIAKLLKLMESVQPPERLVVSPPEGFTYYALHPLDFAHVVEKVSPEPKACAIVGIRSIGTTLSAMTTASLRIQGRPASRITVRPTGHPYSRTLEFNGEERTWIRRQSEIGSQFLIVDEGPGRSGSTFLSVAEALCRAGIDRRNITLIGSRAIDPESLCADDAAARWRSFQVVATTPSVSSRFHDHVYVAGGEWRKLAFETEQHWPESWTQMERLKFLSPDRRTLFKFEGAGPMAAEVRQRAFALARAGFSPAVADGGDGFLAYEFLAGRCMGAGDISRAVLERIADYLAFRSFHFSKCSADSSELRSMAEFNVMQEFGVQLSLPALESQRCPVLADGRMQPHEWIAGESIIKTDSIDHGDNHFFPGPCDIAWDVAGTVIEWSLDHDAIRFLLERLKKLSGTDVSNQLTAYMMAYAVFRLGFCKMAISTELGTSEAVRLHHAYSRYRKVAEKLLPTIDEGTKAA